MRTITGAVLLLAAEQAFAHAYLVGFPNAPIAQDVLIPASGVLGLLGIAFLLWGILSERKDKNGA